MVAAVADAVGFADVFFFVVTIKIFAQLCAFLIVCHGGQARRRF